MAKRQSISMKLFILSIIFLFVYILIYIMSNFFRRYFRTKLIIKIDKEVKSDYLKLLLSKEISDYNLYDSGYYLSRITSDIPTLINDYIFDFFNLILYIFQSIFTIIVALYINWLIALIFIILSFVIIIYTTLFEKKFANLKSMISKKNIDYVTNLKYILEGYNIIKNNMAEENVKCKYKKTLDEGNRFKGKWWRYCFNHNNYKFVYDC